MSWMTRRSPAARLLMAGALLLFAQAAAEARQVARAEPAPNLFDDPSPYLDRIFASAPGAESPEEPAPPLMEIGGTNTEWSIGVALGFLGARNADTPSVFGQFEFRYWLADFFALKLAGSGYRITFDHNNIVTRQFPVTLSAVIFPIPHMELNPYVIVGGGWFHTTVEYRDGFTSLYSNTRTNTFGGHAGGGLEWVHGSASLFLEGSYVFEDPKVNGTGSTDFYHWKFLVGLTLRF